MRSIHDVEVLHDVERKTDDEQEFHDTHGGTEQTVGETEFQVAQKVVETIGHESQSDGKEDAEDEEGNDAQHHVDLRAVDCKVFPLKGHSNPTRGASRSKHHPC